MATTSSLQPTVAMTLNYTGNLAVCLVRPANDLFYNWATSGWEAPFVAANHLKPLGRMEAAPSIFSFIQYADLGDIFLDRNDVAALVTAVDANGNPVSIVDCWTLPSPTIAPTIGGFLR